jgi:hypothetical protein
MRSAGGAAWLAACLVTAGCSGGHGAGGDAADRVYERCMADVQKSIAPSGSAQNDPAASALGDMASQMGKQVCEKARDACRKDPGGPSCQ